MRIEEYIPIGREKAISREMLTMRTGICDRAIRNHIECARRNGIVIINLQDGSGYYQPCEEPTAEEIADVRHYYNAQKRRAMRILEGNKAVSKWLKNKDLGGQMSWNA